MLSEIWENKAKMLCPLSGNNCSVKHVDCFWSYVSVYVCKGYFTHVSVNYAFLLLVLSVF